MSVAEKCLHFSMTESSRGRSRRQKRVRILEGKFLCSQCGALYKNYRIRRQAVCGKGELMPEIEKNENEIPEYVVCDIAKEFNIIVDSMKDDKTTTAYSWNARRTKLAIRKSQNTCVLGEARMTFFRRCSRLNNF